MRSTDTILGSITVCQTAVEVGIWEGYLIRSKANIAPTLCTYSLDNGPLRETEEGHLVFRFTAFDWEKNIQDLLSRNNIHGLVLRTMGIDPHHHLPRKRICIAGEDPEILESLSAILEDAGYHVKTSAGGKLFPKGNFAWVDLFIIDRNMPDADGLQVCRHLRIRSATRETPVIVISARPGTASEAWLAGANDFIEKPFHIHYLLNVISRYTRR